MSGFNQVQIVSEKEVVHWLTAKRMSITPEGMRVVGLLAADSDLVGLWVGVN